MYISSSIFLLFFCYELIECERLEKERVSKRFLSIKDVDMNILDNCKVYYIDKFEFIYFFEDKREFVVRRG